MTKSAQQVIQEAVTEKDFRQTVVDLAQYLGWAVYWTWDSIHSPGGFPDLVLVRDKRLIFAELKTEKKEITYEQGMWLDWLSACAETYIWRPSDMDESETMTIQEILER